MVLFGPDCLFWGLFALWWATLSCPIAATVRRFGPRLRSTFFFYMDSPTNDEVLSAIPNLPWLAPYGAQTVRT